MQNVALYYIEEDLEKNQENTDFRVLLDLEKLGVGLQLAGDDDDRELCLFSESPGSLEDFVFYLRDDGSIYQYRLSHRVRDPVIRGLESFYDLNVDGNFDVRIIAPIDSPTVIKVREGAQWLVAEKVKVDTGVASIDGKLFRFDDREGHWIHDSDKVYHDHRP